MVVGAHVEHAGSADKDLGFLNFIADFGFVDAACLFNGGFGDHQTVVAVAAESGHRAVLCFVLLLIGQQHRFLRIAVRELLGDDQGSGRQPGAFGRVPSELARDGFFFGTYPRRVTFVTELLQRSGIRTFSAHAHGYFRAGKAGFAMLTEALAVECKAQGLRVFGLSPGTIDTDMQVKIRASGMNPVSKLLPEQHLAPEVPAKVIAWLCRAEAADYPQGECAIRDEALAARAGITLPS